METRLSFKLSWSLLAVAAVMGGMLAGCRTESTTSSGETTNPETPSTPTAAARKMPSAEGPKVEGDVIKIGLVASQNGDLRPWGQDSAYGAQLAVEEANAAGGVNGKKIELMIQDSNSDQVQGKSAAEKLAGEGVVGLLGEVASGITKQMVDVAYANGLPLVAIGATRTDLTADYGNTFRVCYTDDLQGPVMAKFAYEELGLRAVAVMTDQAAPYSTGLSESFKKKFEALGGKVMVEEFYKTKDTQFGAQLTNLKGKNPDGLFLSGYFNEVGPIVKQAAQAGLKNVKFLGGDGWDSKEILNTGGEAIVGGFFCNHYNNEDDRPQVQEFLTKWKAKYASLPGTTMGALAYDAAKLMIDALKRAKSLDARSLSEALEGTEAFVGVSGDITLKGQGGNPPKRALVVELTKEGQTFRKAYEAADVIK
jgi:branched-chain amino acid transport system substrate-binding protein